MPLRVARTNAEAQLFMELNPCENCGEREFEPADTIIVVEGDLASRYSGTCPRCGIYREFLFRIPDEPIIPNPEEPVFGDDTPSALIDAGEWMWIADLIARSSPAEPEEGMSAADRQQIRMELRTAAAAVGEAAKFVPPGGDRVPYDAVWSDRGRAVYEDEPGRFWLPRLQVVRRTYREIADRFEDQPA
jgi:hypothetical protein